MDVITENPHFPGLSKQKLQQCQRALCLLAINTSRIVRNGQCNSSGVVCYMHRPERVLLSLIKPALSCAMLAIYK